MRIEIRLGEQAESSKTSGRFDKKSMRPTALSVRIFRFAAIAGSVASDSNMIDA